MSKTVKLIVCDLDNTIYDIQSYFEDKYGEKYGFRKESQTTYDYGLQLPKDVIEREFDELEYVQNHYLNFTLLNELFEKVIQHIQNIKEGKEYEFQLVFITKFRETLKNNIKLTFIKNKFLEYLMDYFKCEMRQLDTLLELNKIQVDATYESYLKEIINKINKEMRRDDVESIEIVQYDDLFQRFQKLDELLVLSCNYDKLKYVEHYLISQPYNCCFNDEIGLYDGGVEFVYVNEDLEEICDYIPLNITHHIWKG